MSQLVRILAPHFVAGVILGERAAPIVAYRRTWSLEQIAKHCRARRWQMEIL